MPEFLANAGSANVVDAISSTAAKPVSKVFARCKSFMINLLKAQVDRGSGKATVVAASMPRRDCVSVTGFRDG